MKRRTFIRLLAGSAVAAGLGSQLVLGAEGEPLLKAIPKSGERLPVIGMGSWLTFDVGDSELLRAERCKVLARFLREGGKVIDSSPMYGSSEAVIGHCLKGLGTKDIFAATKVWTWGETFGIHQMENSRRLWDLERFDLMQVHNLLDWETHLETLKAMKSEGEIRYIGVTTSHGRRHAELEQIMRQEDALDFVQFTYNIADREAEKRLLPLAAERKLAVIINRPFQGGNLFNRIEGRPLPDIAKAFGVNNWAQYFLKFIISHPAVTCTIPATSRVDHMAENMGALYGPLPDEPQRQEMLRQFSHIAS